MAFTVKLWIKCFKYFFMEFYFNVIQTGFPALVGWHGGFDTANFIFIY